MDQFDPSVLRQGILIYAKAQDRGPTTANYLVWDSDNGAQLGYVRELKGTRLTTADIGTIIDGNYTVGPSSYRSLKVGGVEIMPLP